jgi:arylsulfatase A-like enzyme
MKYIRMTSALLFGLVVFQHSVFADPNVTERPNLLFFFIDDQRDTTLGCMGDPIVQTPTIDRLAERGVLFRNAFVTTSICASSRACVMTGLTERTHGYNFGKPPVAESFTRASYPAVLRQAGYRTGFFGKFGANYENFDQLQASEDTKIFDSFENRDRPYLRKQEDGTIRHIDELNTEGAIRFLQADAGQQPFALQVSFSSGHAEDGDKDNHYPFIDAVKDLYSDVTFPEPRLNDPEIFMNQPEFLRESMNRDRYYWRWDTPAKYQKNMRNYYRLISGIDVMMKRVLDTLDAQGLAENTVIIYVADNGYYMGDRGFAGKWSHYEESLRVPMIIMDPRREAKRDVQKMTLNIDVPVTLLDLAGVEIPAHYQGRSLVPFLDGKRRRDWRSDFFCEHRMEHASIPKWEGIRDERYVYARYDGQVPAYEFLHDLKRDPDQLTNLATNPKYAKQLARFRARNEELRTRYIQAQAKP